MRHETQAALGLGAAGARWSESAAWLLLRELYSTAKLKNNFKWTVTERQVSRAQAHASSAPPAILEPSSKQGGQKRQATATKAAAKAVAAATLFAAGEQDAKLPSASASLAALKLEPGAAGVAWAPTWTRQREDGGLDLLSQPSWGEANGSAAIGAAAGTLPSAAFAPLLPRAAELRTSAQSYAARLTRLLHAERDAALSMAEKAVATLEQSSSQPSVTMQALAEQAAGRGATSLDEQAKAAEAAAAAAAASAGAPQGGMSGAQYGADGTSAEQMRAAEVLSEAQQRQLREVRLSNVQQIGGKLGNRTILTIAALANTSAPSAAVGARDGVPPPSRGADRFQTKRRLPRSKLQVGDVVMVRQCARSAAAAAILAEAGALLSNVAVEDDDALCAIDESCLKLRGVVSAQSAGTLTIALDLAPEVAAAEVLEPEAVAAAEAVLAEQARELLGGEVRVDYLGTDVTHARNLNALEVLSRIATEAAESGKPYPALGVIHSLLQPAADGSGGESDADEGGAEGGVEGAGASAAGASAVAAAPAFPSFNPRLDAGQLAAVEAAMVDRRPVTTLQGPPGSGKTAVVVELVQRAVAAGMRVLVCAPSNMAVDGLSVRLAQADEHLRLVRVGNPDRIEAAALNITADKVAKRRAPLIEEEARVELVQMLATLSANAAMGKQRKAQMRDYMRRNSRRMVEKRLARGPAEAMADAQVLLCTTTAAADKAVLALPAFDLVVIDEAAQATAPNAWVPLLRGRRAVLVGDPQQLPPTLLSRSAAAEGLSVSLMETAQTAQPRAHTLLTTQWRMHASIAQWSSTTFYDAQLGTHPNVAERTLADVSGVERTELTAAALVGVRVGIDGGRDGEQRAANGQISNQAEALAAIGHAASLLRAGVVAHDLLIISPYGAQVQLLRRLLGAAAASQRVDERTAALGDSLAAIEVATIDASQGREAEAVIVSLVRSNARRAVGFLADHRRLNVAVTRARRHLALVCDPTTVAADPLLATLMDHVASAGEWRPADLFEVGGAPAEFVALDAAGP